MYHKPGLDIPIKLQSAIFNTLVGGTGLEPVTAGV
jgi:hypothetical protein